ncbi:hypothetical protein ROJ8625_02374 [Roseivivax jejudonensis]|uniref:Methyltransferase FkbM domain-containing protein n=1 Tax=Roseivivax jejudonensis TaxID=1529041 RepID=A0A1X6ZDR4_9RHOB|nr:FkbM family methyltransferase [Roseivivax jejudonensis]SLN48643.1 hypothetical protein ROJ8625_02374 [Roseivivax jejudonensis]
MRKSVRLVRALKEIIPDLAPTSVVDVGANPTETPPYRALMRAGQATVFGFEPDPRAFAELQASRDAAVRYVNAAVGDGGRHTLHVCKDSYMSSLLRPDPRAIEVFPQMGRSLEVVETREIDTAALDDIDDIARIDLLKIDIQGGELRAFENGRRKLGSAVCVQTEVSFFPIYEDQPGFGEIDAMLRGLGLLPHSMPVLYRNPVSPLWARRRFGKQLCDGDIVYLRDIRHLDRMDDHQVGQLAVIAAGVLEAHDICARALDELCARGVVSGAALQQVFRDFPAENGRYAFRAAPGVD